MVSFNRSVLIGNLVRDPELRFTQDGKAVCNFDIAINHNFTNAKGDKKEETVYIPVTVWGKQAESTAKYMKKGRLVLVEGRIYQENWNDKDGNKRSKLKLNCSSIKFLPSGDSKKKEEPKPAEQNAQD